MGLLLFIPCFCKLYLPSLFHTFLGVSMLQRLDLPVILRLVVWTWPPMTYWQIILKSVARKNSLRWTILHESLWSYEIYRKRFTGKDRLVWTMACSSPLMNNITWRFQWKFMITLKFKARIVYMNNLCIMPCGVPLHRSSFFLYL